MRTKLISITAFSVAGVIFISATGTAGTIEPVPPAKLEAQADATPTQVADSEIGTSTQQVAISDSGPAALVEQVREAVPALLTLDASVGRLPGNEAKRAEAVRDKVSARTFTVESVWAASTERERARKWQLAIQSAAADPSYVGYESNRVTALEWQGISVQGDSAYAQFLGYETYELWDGSELNQPRVQFQVSLQRGGPNGWSLVEVRQVMQNA